VSETLASVLTRQPDWTALPPETPATLRNVLRRCLEKDPRQRVHDIADVRLAMDGAFETAAAGTTAVAVPRLRVWQRPLPLGAAIVTLIVATGLAVWALTRPEPPRVVRLTVTPTGATALNISVFAPALAISPDGTRLAYVGAGGHQTLTRLTNLYPEQGRLVELRYFGGLTIEETAEAIGLSPATVKRQWTVAKAWLRRDLKGEATL
jgi:ECF sigma factor